MSNSFTPKLVSVPAGTFEMGFIYQSFVAGSPVHQVTLTNKFEIGKFQVTTTEYCNMLNYALEKGYLAGDYKNNMSVKNGQGVSQELIDLDANFKNIKCDIFFNGTRFDILAGNERVPIVNVTWYGAAFYCNMLSEAEGLEELYSLEGEWSCNVYGKSGYRIPTEAEWEYVARYGNQSFPWGANPTPSGDPNNPYKDFANFGMNEGSLKDVGSYEKGKNALGVYDLVGNAEDWVNDWYGNYSKEQITNPTGPESAVYKEKRGGSWYDDDNNFAIPAYRYDTNYPHTCCFDISFRVVKI